MFISDKIPNKITFFNKIKAKHIDFLICDATNFKPLLVIELDDSSHNKDDRLDRDNFVDRLLYEINLPLLHFSVKHAYDVKGISKKIEAIIQPIENASPKPNVDSTIANEPTPNCIKCGLPMVVRISRSGENKGKRFYGCSNYPKCKETLPFECVKTS